jgi:ubiquinone biosynthesis accessory factor UbiK
MHSMELPNFIEDLQQRLAAMFEASPAADVQRNLKALLAQQFARLDLVTREEFEVQQELLARARARIDALEARLAPAENCGAAAAKTPSS